MALSSDFGAEEVVAQGIIPQLIDQPGWAYHFFKLPLMQFCALWARMKKVLCQRCLGRQPRTNCFFFDGISQKFQEMKQGAEVTSSWRPLDIIYNQPGDTFLERQWLNMLIAQDVRHRLRIVENLLIKDTRRLRLENPNLGTRENPIRVLSLACGLGQSVLNAIQCCKKDGVYVKALFIDMNVDTATYICSRSIERGIADQITFQEGNVIRPRYCRQLIRDFNPHQLEIVGLIDYLSTGWVEQLLGACWEELSPHASVLTGNVSEHPELGIIEDVINWHPMQPRSALECSQLFGSIFGLDIQLSLTRYGIFNLVQAVKE